MTAEPGGAARFARRALFSPPDDATDGQLLDRFLAGRDEVAFAQLVRRHGPMVLGVCRRVLGNVHDAEDAFQAAFLVLVRRAGEFTGRGTVGNFLYGVACHTARKARAAAARRREKEAALSSPTPSPSEPGEWAAVLDRELARLPEKYREPLVLCELEGRPRREVAERLGVPEGTLASRLATAKRRLADRLTRQGVAAPAALLSAGLGVEAVAVPPALAESAVHLAAVAAGHAAGAVPAAVAQLVSEVSRAMFLSKLRLVALVLPAAVALGTAAAAALPGLGEKNPAPKPANAPAPRAGAKPEEDPPGVVGPPRAGEPAWRAEFRKAYGLADGQAVKFVPGHPAFPEVREDFLNAGPYPQRGHEKMLVVLTSDGRSIGPLHAVIEGFGWFDEQTPRGIEKRLRGRPLWQILADGLGIAAPLLEDPADVTATELYADAVFREKASLAQVAGSLQAELREKFGMPVVVTAREEEREVVVARGKYAHKPRPGQLNGVVSIAAEDLRPGVPGNYAAYSCDPPGLFRTLGAYVGRPVIDETDPASWRLVRPPGREGDVEAWTGLRGYLYPRRPREDVRPADGSSARDAVLKHVADQTGVTFAAEKRRVQVLRIERAEPK